MKVRLLNNVFLDGEIREAGTEYEITDKDLLKGFLERGSVVDADTPEPKPEPFGVKGDLVEEVHTADGDIFKKFDSVASGVVYTVNDKEIVSENAYDTAKQDVVRAKIEREQAEARAATAPVTEVVAPGATTETDPLAPTPPPPGTQPTAAQLAEDLDLSGQDSAPTSNQ